MQEDQEHFMMSNMNPGNIIRCQRKTKQYVTNLMIGGSPRDRLGHKIRTGDSGLSHEYKRQKGQIYHRTASSMPLRSRVRLNAPS
jgi:hypothetical protein